MRQFKSKLIYLGIILVTSIIVTILFTYFWVYNTEGDLSGKDLPPVDPEYSERCLELYNRVISRVREIRGLDVDIPLKIVDKKWVLERWGAGTISEEQILDDEVFYKSLLLVPSDFSFGERKNREVGGFMAFYWKGAIYVVKENFNPISESAGEALAHELEHAIQDRYFNIKGDQTYDGNKVHSAIVEGDAVLMGWIYANESLEEKIVGISEENACGKEPITGYESNLHTLYFFPYIFGARFVAKTYLDGGYSKVDEILKNLPRTTEQVLHPEKYVVGESFEKVTIDNIKPIGYRIVKDTRMGEFFVYVFLASHIDDCTAYKAAEGWAGDHIKIYRKDRSFIWKWKILFDEEEDAVEFEKALVRMFEKLGNYDGKSWIISEETNLVPEKLEFERNGRALLITGTGNI